MANTLYKLSNFFVKYPFSNNKISIFGDIIINRSDIVLITGRSGSGKSTLLYALKGLFPDVIAAEIHGSILFNGQPITALSKTEKLKIGLVGQNPDNQMINKIVMDELAFGLENLQVNPDVIKSQILAVSKEFKIEHLLNREIETLSGGEKQKIALLSIILTNPEVILLDEPTAFLDPDSAKSFMDLIHKVSKGKTIIIIEHNVQYIADMINRCFMIEQDGVIDEVDCDVCKISPEAPRNKLKELNNRKLGDALPLFEVKKLSFGYNKNQQIIKNFNLVVYPREIIGIMGRNGSGKSTLLRLLARLIKTKNSIFLYGKEINTYSTKKFYSQLGLLFQNPENHFLLDSVEKELNSDQEMLELFELTKVKQQNPFTLSEGQKRRLSLGILNATFKRSLYLLDEPTFGQDVENKEKIVKLIKDMQQTGVSFIIVSHDYPFLNTICNRIIDFTDFNENV